MASSEDAYADLTRDVFTYGTVSLALAVAHETGVTGILCQAHGPLSSTHIAQQGQLKERYVRELLKPLAVAGLVELEEGTGGSDGTEPHYLVPEQRRKDLQKAGVNCLIIGSAARHLDGIRKCFPLDGPDNAHQHHDSHGHDSHHHGSHHHDSHHHDSHGHDSHGHGSHHHDSHHHDSHDQCCDDDQHVEEEMALIDQWAAVSLHSNTAALLKTPGLKQQLEKGIEVAEVGCGSGRLARHLAAMFPKSRFTVTDLSEKSVQRAQQLAQEAGLTNVTFHVLDLCTTPEDWTERFDWLLASDVIHHVPKPLKVLQNVLRALKPGGHFSVLDEFVSSYLAKNIGDKDAASHFALAAIWCAPEPEDPDRPEGPCWGEEKARELFEKAGFRVLGMTRSGTESMGSSAVCMCQKPE